MATTNNFADTIRKKLKATPVLAAAVEDARFNANIADEIFNARIQAGKTQTEVAKLTGMKQSAIARLEDADHGSPSTTSLRRIASALGKRLEVKFVDSYVTNETSASQQSEIEIEKTSNWTWPNKVDYQTAKLLHCA